MISCCKLTCGHWKRPWISKDHILNSWDGYLFRFSAVRFRFSVARVVSFILESSSPRSSRKTLCQSLWVEHWQEKHANRWRNRGNILKGGQVYNVSLMWSWRPKPERDWARVQNMFKLVVDLINLIDRLLKKHVHVMPSPPPLQKNLVARIATIKNGTCTSLRQDKQNSPEEVTFGTLQYITLGNICLYHPNILYSIGSAWYYHVHSSCFCSGELFRPCRASTLLLLPCLTSGAAVGRPL